MSSPVFTISHKIMDKKRIKTTIGLGYVVKKKVGDIEEDTREGIIMRMRKEMVGCVQDLVGKKKLLVQLKYGNKKDMSSSLLQFLCSKEEVDMDEPKSNLPKIYKC